MSFLLSKDVGVLHFYDLSQMSLNDLRHIRVGLVQSGIRGLIGLGYPWAFCKSTFLTFGLRSTIQTLMSTSLSKKFMRIVGLLQKGFARRPFSHWIFDDDGRKLKI